MRLNHLPKLFAAAAAALALGGLAPAGASAHNCGIAADTKPTRSTATDPAVRASQDLQRARAAAQAMVCLTNEARAANRLPLLAVHSVLRTAAERHSTDMTTLGYFSHTGRDRSTPCVRAERAGWTLGCASIKENISWGSGSQSTPAYRFNSLMGSTVHRANILSPGSKYIGVGVSLYAPNTFTGQAATYTQMFG